MAFRSKGPTLDQIKEIVSDLEDLKSRADRYGITLTGDRMAGKISWVTVRGLVDGIEASKVVNIQNGDTF